MPRRLSQLGPGLAWDDLNDDSWEDLVIATGRTGRLAVYLSEGGKSFRKVQADTPAAADLSSVLGWPDGQGHRYLLAAVSPREASPEPPSEIWVHSLTNLSAPLQKLPVGGATLGPMSLADIDGDGDLDLFVGARWRPGAYPQPVSSTIWINDRGRWRRDEIRSAAFDSIGLVSGATFADLDGDGAPDLALALEWGPVRVFRNMPGRFEDKTMAWGLGETTGWWTSITAGDFNADGQIDLAVGNWGRNTPYELHRDKPLAIYYGDWRGRGTLDLIEAWQDGSDWRPERDRTALTLAWPDLATRFPTHHAYGQATIAELLGNQLTKARSVTATHLDTTLFLNQGSHFKPIPLPNEAQLTPVFSVNVGDYDGDGNEDLFLAQNFFGSASDLSREDSGLGLWLHGTGDGTFRATDSSLSGLRLDGEQRGAALADFNHDGRVDLAVAQNRGPTRLYLNQRAKRGLRVTLQGPPGNPQAIGAQLRVLCAGQRGGPCRPVQAGSGYWSQDSAVQVLGLPPDPVSLWIRWPGGKEQKLPLLEGAWDLRLHFSP